MAEEVIDILRLSLSSADSLCNQLASRSGVGPDLNPNCLTLWWYFWKIFSKMLTEKVSGRQIIMMTSWKKSASLEFNDPKKIVTHNRGLCEYQLMQPYQCLWRLMATCILNASEYSGLAKQVRLAVKKCSGRRLLNRSRTFNCDAEFLFYFFFIQKLRKPDRVKHKSNNII